MTRKYSLMIEGESGSYSAYVRELPTILVTGTSIEDLTERAKDAIRLYWEAMPVDRSAVREVEVEVELPA